ncbi:MAG TPA: class I SAM-dependent methyltransferase [Candidatus Acidoferrum sp.]|nr:class I SAM-dependent methyltransferase [Candidatus Acidoferrum sp.]
MAPGSPRSAKDGALPRRARRALERQLEYQQVKARAAAGHEDDYIARMRARAARARAALERIRPIAADARVLEVGSGAHGLVFYFGATRGVGVDPLAAHYAGLFPLWQRRARTVAARGEDLPFADGMFDVVLCDNVVDHAECPARIVAEIARVLAAGGLLYFTVNFHHAIYSVAARLHSAWNAAGLHFEIGPFADHTVHLTRDSARALFDRLPLRILSEHGDVADAKSLARRRPPRHMGDHLTRVFFKNALYEVIAAREPIA